MVPTARADGLREPLRHALAALDSALAPTAPFDPSQASQTWRLAVSDYAAAALIWPALASLRAQAPGTRLAVLTKRPESLSADLEGDRLDLAFHTREEAPPRLRQRSMIHERYVLVMRRGHPALAQPMTLDHLCTLEHVLMSPDGGGFVANTDRALAERGFTRRVVLSVPNFSSLVDALTQSDLVAMAPERLVRGQRGLVVQEPPLAVPGFEMLMLWPERLHRDPAHVWLRRLIAATSGGLGSEQS